MATALRRRYVVGRDVVSVESTPDGILLEGCVRLRPNALIDICDELCRTARVVSWTVATLGSDGPRFRGWCRWEPVEPPSIPTAR